MLKLLAGLIASVRVFLARLRRHLASEVGEGVISAAIAVLVMAFLGVVMWTAFNGIFNRASEKVGDQIEQIGQ